MYVQFISVGAAYIKLLCVFLSACCLHLECVDQASKHVVVIYKNDITLMLAYKCTCKYICTSCYNHNMSRGHHRQADECPVGHYCPLGSVTPQACPPGTYNSATRRQDVADCANCTGGRYCPYWNMTSAGDLCDAGAFSKSHFAGHFTIVVLFSTNMFT